MSIRPLLIAFCLTLASLAAGRAQAMTFAIVDDPAVCAERRCIVASGAIEDDSAGAFARFLKANKIGAGDLLLLDSEGGDLLASLKMGNLVRTSGMATQVQAVDAATGRFRRGGECASACAYVFVGGVARTLGEGARLGVHQIYTAGETWRMSAEDGLHLMSLVAAHVNRLCGNLDVLIPTLRTPPHEIYWLSSTELARFALVTDSAQG